MKWKRFAAALTAAACSAAMLTTMPVSLAEAATAVSNDFEVEYEGWCSTSDAATLTAVDGIGFGGTRGMLISGRTAPQDGACSAKGFFLHGGVKYDYSVKVYSETEQTFRLTLLTKDIDSGEETLKELDRKTVKPGQWATLSASDKAAYNSGEFKLTITTDSTDDFRFDDLKIMTKEQLIVAEAAELGLKDEFAPYFRIGNILNGSTVNDSAIKNILLKDCNAIECENETKPDQTLKSVNGTDVTVGFGTGAAAILDWASKNNIAFRGHTLVWHSQTPESFFKQGGSWVDKSTMSKRMENYIKGMFNLYKSQYPNVNLYAYDVCNECISDDAGACNNGDGARGRGYGQGNSPWVQIYGNNSFIEEAFTYARTYAPSTCKLFYNDYNEHASYKRDCIYRTCKSLYEKGLLDGVGMQSHVTANANDWAGGTEAYLNAMDKYLSIGCDVQVTELDVSVKDSNENAQVTKYKTIFEHAMNWNKKHPRPSGRVTLIQIWGPNDGHSWLDSGSNALLYTSSNQPKAAYNGLTSMISKSEWGDGTKYVDDGSPAPTPREPAAVNSDGYWFHYDFEDGTQSWTSRGGETVTTSSNTQYGSQCLSVAGRENAWQGPQIEVDTSVLEPGKTYSFAANVMYESGSESSKFHFTMSYGSGDDTVYTKIATETVNKGQWTQLANTSFKIPSGATSNVHIYLETDGSDIQDFYVDEVVAAPEGTIITGPKAVPPILGDVNCDGQITAADLSALKAALRNDGKFASSQAKKNADVDKSRKVTATDAQLLRDFLLTKITDFPQGEIEVEEVDFSAMEAKFRGITLATSIKKDNENNPMTTQRFGADPGFMVYKGRLYVYTTNDAFEYSGNTIKENSYAVQTINCVSSADLVNWTDHGAIPAAGNSGACKWASRSWAPDACWKTIKGQDKFFIYFADSANGIGVMEADSPTGPWHDPIGKAIANRQTNGCQDVDWMFDPAVLVDDDGTGYLYFGGGIEKHAADNPGTARCCKLSDDMTSLSGTPTQMWPPYLFEDSSILKIGDTYVYSYCTNFSTNGQKTVNGHSFNSGQICYMTSKNPLGPWGSEQFQGMMFDNTGNQGLDNGGNNHHSLVYFKDKYYLLYHCRQAEIRMRGKTDNYRSTQIDYATVNGTQISVKGTMKGVDQVEKLNPYETVQAETMAQQAGIQIKGLGDTVVTDIQKGDWIKVKGVDFSQGCKAITVRASSSKGGVIKVTTGSPSGEAFAYVEVSGGSMQDYTLACNNIEGVNDICFVFSDELEFDSWSFTAG